MTAMRVLDLFSGIGGFSLGLERAGMRTVAFCEIEPFCSAVLAHHWPGVPIHGDIRELRGGDVGAVDVVCGGFPCQPWSAAGKHRGTGDDRDLWPEMRRVIAEVRPRWVVGENVAGFVSNPMGLDRCLADLEAEGYTCWPVMVPACATGAPHRRDRVWIVAHATGQRRGEARELRRDGPEEWAGGCGAAAADATGAGLEVGRRESGDAGEECATPERDRAFAPDPTSERRREGWSELSGRQRQPASVDGGRSPGRDAAQPGFRRVDAGLPGWMDGYPVPQPTVEGRVVNRVARLKALGNAVVPQVVEAIGRAIMAAA